MTEETKKCECGEKDCAICTPVTEVKEGAQTNSEPKPTKTIEPTDEGKVLIDRSVLEQILEKQKENDKTIDMLKEVADKDRLFKWEGKNKGEIIRKAKVGTWLYEDKESGENVTHEIVGWKMIKDEVGVDTKGVVQETQIIRLFLYNGEEKPIEVDVNYLDFSRNTGRKWGDIVKESRNKDGETRTLKFEDGKEIELSIAFLNL